MRTAGVVFVAIAVLVTAGFWLISTDVTYLGTSISCGTPIANTSPRGQGGEIGDAVAARCGSENSDRVGTGLILGIITLIAGLVMLRVADKQDDAGAIASGMALQRPVRRSAARSIIRYLLMLCAVFALGILLVVGLASL